MRGRWGEGEGEVGGEVGGGGGVKREGGPISCRAAWALQLL